LDLLNHVFIEAECSQSGTMTSSTFITAHVLVTLTVIEKGGASFLLIVT